MNTLYRFFEDYKKNEHKEVKVDEFLGADLARKTISEAMVSALTSAIYDSISDWSHHCITMANLLIVRCTQHRSERHCHARASYTFAVLQIMCVFSASICPSEGMPLFIIQTMASMQQQEALLFLV